MTMTDLREHPARPAQVLDADPVHLLSYEPVDLDLVRASHHDGVPVRVQLRDVEGPASAEPETSALTHRVRGQSCMLSEHPAVAVHDGPGREGLRDASAA